ADEVEPAAPRRAAKARDGEKAPAAKARVTQPPYIADLYGYLVLGVGATVRVMASGADAKGFYSALHFDAEEPETFVTFPQSRAVVAALPGADGMRLALANAVVGDDGERAPLAGVLVARPGQDELGPGREAVKVVDL